ncbi:MAG: VOC family protein [Chthoniobacter sp.]|uniref:VOC family protein n=1 Tax=Chthoniobacter sp. TaxID=2510640 RepID=UPI0032A2DBA7
MTLTKLDRTNNRRTMPGAELAVIPFTNGHAHPSPTNRERRRKHTPDLRRVRLGHVHLKVRDLNRSLPFYVSVLGLRLREWAGRYAFLAFGDEHHSLALEEIGTWTTTPSRRAVGVAHFAIEVPDRAAFAAMRRKLSEANVPFISRNNGISWTVRFHDPDKNEIEIYVDRRRAPGGTELWRGRWHLPESAALERTPAMAA